jgi:hypothetical protein
MLGVLGAILSAFRYSFTFYIGIQVYSNFESIARSTIIGWRLELHSIDQSRRRADQRLFLPAGHPRHSRWMIRRVRRVHYWYLDSGTSHTTGSSTSRLSSFFSLLARTGTDEDTIIRGKPILPSIEHCIAVRLAEIHITGFDLDSIHLQRRPGQYEPFICSVVQQCDAGLDSIVGH